MKLNVVEAPEPNTRLFFVGDRAPLARGFGLETFECGACGELLVVHSSGRDIAGAVFRCPRCGSCNEADERPAGGRR